ncbi:MAG: hypothetical protein R6V03_00865 [Kiritimatiellia bacterium]
MHKLYITLWIVSILLFSVLLAANVFMGELNQDEGWYLYSGRLVSEGKLPFIDFASTQGPVTAFVYAAAGPFVNAWGMAGGRLFSALLGFVSVICAAVLAAVMVHNDRQRRSAGLIAFALAGVNVYQAAFFATVKTYAPGALFITAGYLALAVSWRAGKAGWPGVLLAGISLGLAAAVRISAGIILPIVFVGLLFSRGRAGLSFVFAAGAAAVCAGAYLPFLINAPRAFQFGIFEYHAGREAGGPLSYIIYKAGFLSRFARAYFVALALVTAGFLYRLFNGRRAGGDKPADPADDQPAVFPVSLLWLGFAGVSLVHFLAPFPYDDYQVMIFPLFASAAAVFLVRLVSGMHNAQRTTHSAHLSLTVILLCALSSFSSPINQEWFVAGRDLIWWPVKSESSVAKLRRTAELIRPFCGSDGKLLTQDTYLAVEAGLRVPEGLEMGPFSYYPDWEREKAEACHVLNREMMKELVGETTASVAAVSDWWLAVKAPSITPVPSTERAEIMKILEERYNLFKTIDNFGQARTPLEIYVKKVE